MFTFKDNNETNFFHLSQASDGNTSKEKRKLPKIHSIYSLNNSEISTKQRFSNNVTYISKNQSDTMIGNQSQPINETEKPFDKKEIIKSQFKTHIAQRSPNKIHTNEKLITNLQSELSEEQNSASCFKRGKNSSSMEKQNQANSKAIDIAYNQIFDRNAINKILKEGIYAKKVKPKYVGFNQPQVEYRDPVIIDTIKNLKKDIVFIKSIFDYSYPKIIIEKVKCMANRDRKKNQNNPNKNSPNSHNKDVSSIKEDNSNINNSNFLNYSNSNNVNNTSIISNDRSHSHFNNPIINDSTKIEKVRLECPKPKYLLHDVSIAQTDFRDRRFGQQSVRLMYKQDRTMSLPRLTYHKVNPILITNMNI